MTPDNYNRIMTKKESLKKNISGSGSTENRLRGSPETNAFVINGNTYTRKTGREIAAHRKHASNCSCPEKKTREQRMREVKARRDQEFQRRQVELKEARDHEDRRLQLLQQERLERVKLLKEREKKKLEAVLVRRKLLQEAEQQKRQAWLLKNNVSSHKDDAKDKKPVFAFGSSTPRVLSYLDNLKKDEKVYNTKLKSVPFTPKELEELCAGSKNEKISHHGKSGTSVSVARSGSRPPHSNMIDSTKKLHSASHSTRPGEDLAHTPSGNLTGKAAAVTSRLFAAKKTERSLSRPRQSTPDSATGKLSTSPTHQDKQRTENSMNRHHQRGQKKSVEAQKPKAGMQNKEQKTNLSPKASTSKEAEQHSTQAVGSKKQLHSKGRYQRVQSKENVSPGAQKLEPIPSGQHNVARTPPPIPRRSPVVTPTKTKHTASLTAAVVTNQNTVEAGSNAKINVHPLVLQESGLGPALVQLELENELSETIDEGVHENFIATVPNNDQDNYECAKDQNSVLIPGETLVGKLELENELFEVTEDNKEKVFAEETAQQRPKWITDRPLIPRSDHALNVETEDNRQKYELQGTEEDMINQFTSSPLIIELILDKELIEMPEELNTNPHNTTLSISEEHTDDEYTNQRISEWIINQPIEDGVSQSDAENLCSPAVRGVSTYTINSDRTDSSINSENSQQTVTSNHDISDDPTDLVNVEAPFLQSDQESGSSTDNEVCTVTLASAHESNKNPTASPMALSNDELHNHIKTVGVDEKVVETNNSIDISQEAAPFSSGEESGSDVPEQLITWADTECGMKSTVTGHQDVIVSLAHDNNMVDQMTSSIDQHENSDVLVEISVPKSPTFQNEIEAACIEEIDNLVLPVPVKELNKIDSISTPTEKAGPHINAEENAKAALAEKRRLLKDSKIKDEIPASENLYSDRETIKLRNNYLKEEGNPVTTLSRELKIPEVALIDVDGEMSSDEVYEQKHPDEFYLQKQKLRTELEQKEKEEKFRKEQAEREERKKRLSAIMARTRQPGSSNTSPVSTASKSSHNSSSNSSSSTESTALNSSFNSPLAVNSPLASVSRVANVASTKDEPATVTNGPVLSANAALVLQKLAHSSPALGNLLNRHNMSSPRLAECTNGVSSNQTSTPLCNGNSTMSSSMDQVLKGRELNVAKPLDRGQKRIIDFNVGAPEDDFDWLENRMNNIDWLSNSRTSPSPNPETNLEPSSLANELADLNEDFSPTNGFVRTFSDKQFFNQSAGTIR